MAEQDVGGGGRGNDGGMDAQNPGRGERGNYVAAVSYPVRGGRGNGGATAAQNPGRGGRGNYTAAVWYPVRRRRGRGNDGATAAQNPGRGGRGNYVAAVWFPVRRGRGNDGAVVAQNPGRGGRGNYVAVVWNPGRGGRGNDGAMAAENLGRGGRGNGGAMAAENPGRGWRGNGGARAVQNPGRGPWGIIGAVLAEDPGFLPPNETLGGYIFMCNDDTLPAITELMIFGYPVHFLDRVGAITPGLPLFLYNLSTYRLHGVYEAADSGGFNIEPRFFPCVQDLRRSSLPAQVRVRWRTEYQPLNEQISRGIMVNLRTPQNNFYLYRVELRDPEAANIINVFAQHGVAPE